MIYDFVFYDLYQVNYCATDEYKVLHHALFSRMQDDSSVHLPAETRSDVPAYGRFLAASGDPLPCQVPLLPQTRHRIRPVNIPLEGRNLAPGLTAPLLTPGGF